MEEAAAEPLRLVQAAKSAHLSLQAALTAALAGSANIGASPPKLRADWLRYFEERRESEDARPPNGVHVMGFLDLLNTATSGEGPRGWLNGPLELQEGEPEQLDRLTALRHAFEHPKQLTHCFEPLWIKQSIPPAVRLVDLCLGAVFHHFEEDEIAEVKLLAARIAASCSSARV